MKKNLLSIIAIASLTIVAKAQTPDFGFENWAPISPPLVTAENPVGWASLNALSIVGTAQSVFKETTTPAVGLISAKIVTVKVMGVSIPNPSRPGKNVDTAGILSIGKTQLTTPYLINGNNTFPAFPRPSMLSFQSKYTPVGNDSAFIVAILTKWNGTKRDTIATGKYATGVTSSAYTSNNLMINYNPAFSTIMPDSQQVFISSSIYSHDGAQLGSTFYIDDLAWSGYVPVGINDIARTNNIVSVFPNPTNNQINFNSTVDVSIMEITDITGRLIGSYKMTDNKLKIQIANFVPGVYLYSVLNDKKEIVNRGKFEVTK